MIYLLIAVVAIIVIYVISTYNYFVSTKTRIGASIQEIGNQLKRQSELIPNLEESVKGYLTHEKDIYDKLTEARKAIQSASKSGNLKEMSEAGAKLSEILPKIQVVVESNPQLRGADVVTNLMDELRDTSDKVMYARRLLIDLTADYNVRCVSFPTNIVAGMFHFTKLPGLETPADGEFLKVTESQVETPKVDLK
jgi:LemA protein